jgi:hypothetical protein
MTRVTMIFLTLCAALAAAPRADAAPPDAYRSLLERRAPAIVTIKFVLRVSGGQLGEEEQEGEASGVLISQDGLVLCSSTQIGGFASLYRAMGMEADFTVTPENVRVLIGDDVEGVEATVVARDSELDLAWVQITEPGEEGYPFVDVEEAGADMSPGTELLAIGCLPEYYGRARVVVGGHIAGMTTKPRPYIVPSQELAAEAGVPVFTADENAFVGMLVLVTPEAEDVGGALNSDRIREMIGVFVLPASDVARATARAREAAAVE